MWSWSSCTQAPASSAAFFTQLRTSCNDAAARTTPLSDVRTLSAIALAYVVVVTTASRLTRRRIIASPSAHVHARGTTHNRAKKSGALTLLTVTHNAILCLLSLGMHAEVSRALAAHAATVAGGTAAAASFWQKLEGTLCLARGTRLPARTQRALYVFLLSKLYELLDTAFLVARGRALTVLHVWHHASVIIEVWAWLNFDFGAAAHGMWFNTLVHVVMYGYFTITALPGVRVPPTLKVTITRLQIVQFVTGFAAIVPFWRAHTYLAEGCAGVPALVVSSVANGSYLVLFLRFYSKTYLGKKKNRDKSVNDGTAKVARKLD